MSEEVKVPVVSEDILSKWGISISEFKEKFAEQWDSMKLVHLSFSDLTDDKKWCIVMHMYMDDIYLYLTKTDGEYSFSQFGNNVDFWNKIECEKIIDVVKVMRSNRISGANKVLVKMYNPYTKELI